MSHERRSTAEQVAISLAWIGIGVGLVELAAPGAFAKLTRVRPSARSTRVLRTIGAVKVATGVALLATKRTSGGPIEAAAAVTIGRPIEEVYEFWEDIESFPRFMRNVESVTDLGDGRSHWRVTGPAGIPVEWESEIVADRENRLISWQSVPGSLIDNHGSIRFQHAPGARGTEVHATISYWPPAGQLGHAAAFVFGTSPRQQLREGLHRIKQLLEVGEISLSDGPGLSRPGQPARSKQVIDRLVGVES